MGLPRTRRRKSQSESLRCVEVPGSGSRHQPVPGALPVVCPGTARHQRSPLPNLSQLTFCRGCLHGPAASAPGCPGRPPVAAHATPPALLPLPHSFLSARGAALPQASGLRASLPNPGRIGSLSAVSRSEGCSGTASWAASDTPAHPPTHLTLSPSTASQRRLRREAALQASGRVDARPPSPGTFQAPSQKRKLVLSLCGKLFKAPRSSGGLEEVKARVISTPETGGADLGWVRGRRTGYLEGREGNEGKPPSSRSLPWLPALTSRLRSGRPGSGGRAGSGRGRAGCLAGGRAPRTHGRRAG